MNEPNERARELLQRYRGAIGPSDAQRDALVRSVMMRIDGATAPSGGGAPSSVVPWLTLVGVALLVGGASWIGARDPAADAPREVVPSAVVESLPERAAPVAPQIVALQPPAIATPVVAPPPVAPPKAARRPRAIEKPAPAKDAEPIEALTLVDEEVRLLREANLALRRGDEREARARFDEHARRFPDGSLAELREVGRALLRCRDDATAIDDFARRFPGSPHIARLERECAREDR